MLYDQDFLNRLEAGLRSALPGWGLSTSAKLRLLTISENATYLAQEGAARLILRVHRPNYHTEAEIRSELAWIAALHAASIITTPRPIPLRNGELLAGFSDGQSQRFAVAFEYMSGDEPDTSHNLVKWYKVLGEITARLHQHSRQWQRPANFARKLWSFETIIGPRAHWGDWRLAPGLDAAGKATLERAAALLAAQTKAYGQTPDRFGLIHCDMRTANLLVEAERLGVIDFDDCGMSWFVYDFAASVSFMEHESFIPDLMAAWLEGYRHVAPLADEHAQALPMFVMLRRIQLTAWIATHAETPTAQAMGEAYTNGSVALAARYLSEHGL
ncbi:MAG: aminoglycoside phosphotransferase [Acidocella sp. 20-57-95]|nr:MAG: aminoglycoside phosphotransferase [Acidocella sp. 20-57-95]HQT63886.1 phosphotransferase [Acidocella sp.]HQU05173.1 phosphotransferase [Acidocella sp.]